MVAKTTRFKNESGTKNTIMKVFAILCIAASGLSIYKYIDDMDSNYNEKNITTNVAYLSQSMLRASSSAIEGNPNSFKSLSNSQEKASEQLNLLLKGGVSSTGMKVPEPKDSILGQLNTFKDTVNDVINNINYIIGEKQDILDFNASLDKYHTSLNKVLIQIRALSVSPSLNNTNAQVVLNKIYQNLSNDRVTNFGNSKDMLNSDYLTNQNFIIQVISSHVKEMSSLPGEISRLPNATKISRDMDNLFVNMQDLNANAVKVLDLLPSKINAMKYQTQIDGMSDRLNSAYDSLNYILKSDAGDINLWLYFSGIFMVIALFALLVVLRNREDGIVVGNDRERTKRYKDALTTVDENVHGLFSDDSINREYLNKMTIPYSNKTLSKILEKVRRFASTLVMNNDMLTKEISDLHALTNKPKQLVDILKGETENNKRKLEKIANGITNIIHTSTHTKKVVEDAKIESDENINNTKSGSLKIQDTISKMNSIRDTMQNTQKRVKKLSESSQGIGEITDTIRTIASKIQVISINAAIEATEAGEAGRKFLVVSKEIEKLAEGANMAVKKIDKIVEDILGDAKQTLSAMDTSTAEVVEGALSADVAGDSLKDINFILDRLQSCITEVQKGTEKDLNQLTEVLQELTIINERYDGIENSNNILNNEINKMDGKISDIRNKMNKYM